MPVLSRSFNGGRERGKDPRRGTLPPRMPARPSGFEKLAEARPPVRPARARLTVGQSQAPPTPPSLIQPDHLDPQSQSLSRSYGSNLPISLTYILPSTRGCSPRRPDADIGTIEGERPIALPSHRIFKGQPGTTTDGTETSRSSGWPLTAVSVTLSPHNGIPGSRSLKQKRKLFPGSPTASPVCVALPRP